MRSSVGARLRCPDCSLVQAQVRLVNVVHDGAYGQRKRPPGGGVRPLSVHATPPLRRVPAERCRSRGAWCTLHRAGDGGRTCLRRVGTPCSARTSAAVPWRARARRRRRRTRGGACGSPARGVAAAPHAQQRRRRPRTAPASAAALRPGTRVFFAPCQQKNATQASSRDAAARACAGGSAARHLQRVRAAREAAPRCSNCPKCSSCPATASAAAAAATAAPRRRRAARPPSSTPSASSSWPVSKT